MTLDECLTDFNGYKGEYKNHSWFELGLKNYLKFLSSAELFSASEMQIQMAVTKYLEEL